MPGTPTTRFGLPTVAGTDLVRDLDTEITALADAIDLQMVGYSEGPIGSRPTSTPGTPGIKGRVYLATDTGTFYIDMGTGWQAVGSSSGSSIIATEEARTNTAYGLLTTPDRVQNVVLPTDGLMCVAYQAAWKESVNSAARAAVFIGANQLKLAAAGEGAPAVQEAHNPGAADTYMPLSTHGLGLGGERGSPTYSTPHTADVTTGQVLGDADQGAANDFNSTVFVPRNGGPVYVFAAAGTYDISIQFKASSGSVTAKDRKLWVWTRGF